MTQPADETSRDHWEGVYARKAADSVSWYRPHLETSLALLKDARLGPGSRVIDVGCGASTLVDDLLARGVRDITVLDLSRQALDVARARLGELGAGARRDRRLRARRSGEMQWVVAHRSALDIAALMGPSFRLVKETSEVHATPEGRPQAFAWAVLQRV